MAYKKILVPLDGSETAERALSYAKSIARLKNSNLVLFAVSLTIFADRRDRLFTSYLQVTANELNQEGIKATTASSYGDVAEEIVKYANNNKIDMIVMATHGYTKAKQWMFGSITQKVLYRTKMPIFLIKSKSPDPTVEFDRILVPLDGSPFSESAFPHVLELARNSQKEVLLLHICEPPVVPSYGSRPINPTWKKSRDDMWEEMERLSENYLKQKVAELKKKRIRAKSKVVKAQSGEVVKNILQISREEKIDLIIITSQGRSGVSNWVYGRTATKIVEEFPQPLLIIRPPTLIPSSPPQNLLDNIWHGFLARKT